MHDFCLVQRGVSLLLSLSNIPFVVVISRGMKVLLFSEPTRESFSQQPAQLQSCGTAQQHRVSWLATKYLTRPNVLSLLQYTFLAKLHRKMGLWVRRDKVYAKANVLLSRVDIVHWHGQDHARGAPRIHDPTEDDTDSPPSIPSKTGG
jgi:hypothetical protein